MRNMLCTTAIMLVASLAFAADSAPKTAKAPEAKAQKGEKVSANPHVILETSMGPIEVELFADKAPISTKNFLEYVEKGHYNGTIFHRVINNFMIQGGGFNKEMVQKPTAPPIKNEATNGLKNDVYTLAMARTSVVDSATSQFFINVKDNGFLNNSGTTPQQYGYAVFGKVVAGMDVVDKIKTVPTGAKNGMTDVPISIVEIKSAKKK